MEEVREGGEEEWRGEEGKGGVEGSRGAEEQGRGDLRKGVVR